MCSSYDGTGAPKQYTDVAIIICHELRKVFLLPLRQSQGFIDSYFRLKGLSIRCPDYSCLSKRLGQLNILCPRYQKKSSPEQSVSAVAIDSTGLKRFGRDEWHQEKHKISGKRSWRKLHIAVDDEHYFRGCVLTDCFVGDDKALEPLIEQVEGFFHHVSADGVYDKNPVYEVLSTHFPDANIVIPAHSNAVFHDKNHVQRNRNILEIKAFGRMNWQKQRQYGRRNLSELAIQRYKRLLGNTTQSRELRNQKLEAMIGCGVLNKMTALGMPISYRSA